MVGTYIRCYRHLSAHQAPCITKGADGHLLTCAAAYVSVLVSAILCSANISWRRESRTGKSKRLGFTFTHHISELGHGGASHRLKFGRASKCSSYLQQSVTHNCTCCCLQ